MIQNNPTIRILKTFLLYWRGICRSGGIGIRARLKIASRKGWEFKSPLRHKNKIQDTSGVLYFILFVLLQVRETVESLFVQYLLLSVVDLPHSSCVKSIPQDE